MPPAQTSTLNSRSVHLLPTNLKFDTAERAPESPTEPAAPAGFSFLARGDITLPIAQANNLGVSLMSSFSHSSDWIY